VIRISSKSLDKKTQEIPILQIDQPLQVKNIIIPFSQFAKTENFIYYGHEKIPFHQRHPVYQEILKQEFT
jgi:hypothetical protein